MQRASVYYVGEFCGRVELPWIYAKPRNLSDPNPIANQAIGLEEAAKSRSQLSHIAAEMEMLYLVLKNDREMNDAKVSWDSTQKTVGKTSPTSHLVTLCCNTKVHM